MTNYIIRSDNGLLMRLRKHAFADMVSDPRSPFGYEATLIENYPPEKLRLKVAVTPDGFEWKLAETKKQDANSTPEQVMILSRNGATQSAPKIFDAAGQGRWDMWPGSSAVDLVVIRGREIREESVSIKKPALVSPRVERRAAAVPHQAEMRAISQGNGTASLYVWKMVQNGEWRKIHRYGVLDEQWRSIEIPNYQGFFAAIREDGVLIDFQLFAFQLQIAKVTERQVEMERTLERREEIERLLKHQEEIERLFEQRSQSKERWSEWPLWLQQQMIGPIEQSPHAVANHFAPAGRPDLDLRETTRRHLFMKYVNGQTVDWDPEVDIEQFVAERWPNVARVAGSIRHAETLDLAFRLGDSEYLPEAIAWANGQFSHFDLCLKLSDIHLAGRLIIGALKASPGRDNAAFSLASRLEEALKKIPELGVVAELEVRRLYSELLSLLDIEPGVTSANDLAEPIARLFLRETLTALELKPAGTTTQYYLDQLCGELESLLDVNAGELIPRSAKLNLLDDVFFIAHRAKRHRFEQALRGLDSTLISIRSLFPEPVNRYLNFARTADVAELLAVSALAGQIAEQLPAAIRRSGDFAGTIDNIPSGGISRPEVIAMCLQLTDHVKTYRAEAEARRQQFQELRAYFPAGTDPASQVAEDFIEARLEETAGLAERLLNSYGGVMLRSERERLQHTIESVRNPDKSSSDRLHRMKALCLTLRDKKEEYKQALEALLTNIAPDPSARPVLKRWLELGEFDSAKRITDLLATRDRLFGFSSSLLKLAWMADFPDFWQAYAGASESLEHPERLQSKKDVARLEEYVETVDNFAEQLGGLSELFGRLTDELHVRLGKFFRAIDWKQDQQDLPMLGALLKAAGRSNFGLMGPLITDEAAALPAEMSAGGLRERLEENELWPTKA